MLSICAVQSTLTLLLFLVYESILFTSNLLLMSFILLLDSYHMTQTSLMLDILGLHASLYRHVIFSKWIDIQFMNFMFNNETSFILVLIDCFTEDSSDFNNLIANNILLRYTVRIQVILFWILRWQSDEQYTVNSYCWPKLILFWKI